MVKNDLWTCADMIKLDGISRRAVQDESTRLELFEKGESDSVSLGTNGLAKYGEDPRVMVEAGNTIRCIEINLNSAEKPWLHDVRFRKAIFYSCDRNALAKLTNTIAAPYFFSSVTTGIPSTGTPYRETAEAKANVPANGGYDPELAKKLMAEVMKDYNLSKVEVRLIYNETVEAARLCSEFQQKLWSDLFGADKFSVELTALPTASALKIMRATQKAPSAEWDMCWSHWGVTAGIDYPAKRVTKYTTADTTRYTNYTSERLNNLYADMLKDENRFDEQKMLKLYAEAEKTVLDEMLVVPVIQTQTYKMKSSRMLFPVDQYITGFGWGTMFADMKQ
jgi:oligopeptide transport system substrate-binding protein